MTAGYFSVLLPMDEHARLYIVLQSLIWLCSTYNLPVKKILKTWGGFWQDCVYCIFPDNVSEKHWLPCLGPCY